MSVAELRARLEQLEEMVKDYEAGDEEPGSDSDSDEDSEADKGGEGPQDDARLEDGE
jgi:hypothetical protein